MLYRSSQGRLEQSSERQARHSVELDSASDVIWSKTEEAHKNRSLMQRKYAICKGVIYRGILIPLGIH
jgi:hypothetical protein